MGTASPQIDRVETTAYTIPTDSPEADGTLEWDSTTLVLVEIGAGGQRGLGYTYASAASAVIIDTLLRPEIERQDPMAIPHCWRRMVRAVRNQGRGGVAAMAISAVDNALWDLKAKLLGLPLASLLGRVRDAVPIYGSGGFTSYSPAKLQEQVAGWVGQGIRQVKIKVGRDVGEGLKRLAAAREAIGPEAGLMADANSAFGRKDALRFAEASVDHSLEWLEQPLDPADLEGLRLLRRRAPSAVRIADGEYGYDPVYFRRMLAAGAVDVLMPDATRCGGVSGFLQAAALAAAFHTPISSHCAPLLHCHLGCSVEGMLHAEYFHDHVRIEERFFEGMPSPVEGGLKPDPNRPGLGITFRRADAASWQIYGHPN